MIFDNVLLVSTQVLILFMLMAVGFAARKIRLLDDPGLLQLTNLLLIFVTPCVIIKAFQTPFDSQLLRNLLIALASALATHALGAILGRIVFRRRPDAQSRVLSFSVCFTNCVFMCIPILDAVLGPRGVLYGSVYVMTFNLAQWTYGVLLMSGRSKEIRLRQALINPGTVAILIAVPLFLLGITLPAVPTAVIGYLAALNTPVAMVIIGGQMAAISLRDLFSKSEVYVSSLLRLLAVPLITLFILHALHFDRVLLLACLIPAAAPTAAVTALFAKRFNQDSALATQTITFSTLFSCLTIPLIILISDWVGYAA